MKNVVILMIFIWAMVLPTEALEIEAPDVPEVGQKWMPDNTESFGHALFELLNNVLLQVNPEIKKAAGNGLKVLCVVLILSVLQSFSGTVKMAANLAGVISISTVLLLQANSMISIGTETVIEITDYCKLLLPVMTGAMAAQGGITTSAALYAGTAMFNAVLSSMIRGILIPGIYLFLAISVVSNATDENVFKRIGELLKNSIVWMLKILLMVFTTYLGLTGVVNGTTDMAALKATKVTISSFVPVVGGVLSDASEAVLVSVGLMKNAAGIYGMIAVLAVFLHPFLQISAHYVVLKITNALCSIFGSKNITGIIECFSVAMGLLLAIIASCCIIVLVSTICFMRGVQ